MKFGLLKPFFLPSVSARKTADDGEDARSALDASDVESAPIAPAAENRPPETADVPKEIDTVQSDASDVESAPKTPVAKSKTPDLMTPRERFDLAHRVACFFADKQSASTVFSSLGEEMKAEIDAMREIDAAKFDDVLKRMGTMESALQNNAFCAFVIFFALSGGRYPLDCMQESVKEYDALKQLATFFSETCKPSLTRTTAEQISQTIKTSQKNSMKDVVSVLSENMDAIGCVKTFEILWKVFVRKDCTFSPLLFKKMLGEFASQDHIVRKDCEFGFDEENVQIFAVSVEGKTQKPMHVECEDACKVVFYNKSIWLAIAADGVGSALNSSIGSAVAASALESVIRNYLIKQGVIGQNPRKFVRNVKETVWQQLMYYIRFSLASDLYSEWVNQLPKANKNLPSGESTTDESYLTTLQFAFGCPQFIACGRVGDGSFYVRKHERFVSAGTRAGGIFLNDGISGVTQNAVLSVGHLKNNPSAMLVSFFRPDEISDIVISSDGVSGAIGISVDEAEAFIGSLAGLPFEEKRRNLKNTVMRCSEYNETGHGSGDDSTIVYVHMK